jgi:hypothetical protein
MDIDKMKIIHMKMEKYYRKMNKLKNGEKL